MTEWVPRFDYPASNEWLWLDVNLPDPDGAKQVARQVAERGGWGNRRYAKEVYRELKADWGAARERKYEPVVVYVPHVRSDTPPVSPASIDAKRYTPNYERTVEATLARLRERQTYPVAASYVHGPEVTAVELPAGPACRLHAVVATDTGFGDKLLSEYVDHYVMPEVYSEDMLMLRAFWAKDSVPGMVDLADRIAHTLTFKQRGSGEESPRPVLDVP